MPQTLAEKIIARAAGRATVRPGEIVTCRVDLAMVHDASGPRRLAPLLAQIGATVWDRSKLVVITDHYVPAFDDESRAIQKLTRKWVAAHDGVHFYEQQGICHVVLPERGHLRPGLFVVGGDSHSPTGGAFGCFMFGVGATDMAGIVATGETWIRVPETIRIDCTGTFAPGVCAKDVMLALCARLGMDGGDYQVIQYSGSLVSSLPMQERMTLCNMATELGAIAGMIAADDVTAAFVKQASGTDVDPSAWQGDDDAIYRETIAIDGAALAPQVAAPHSPANAAPVDAHRGVRIDRAYIGACTGAKLADLRMAAELLKGRHIAPGVRLTVAPASQRDTEAAAADGTLAILTEAGADLVPTGCGACAGHGKSALTENEVCISSTSRNFKGRMGHESSLVYLGSPYTVAAAAVAGEIRDPREILSETVH